MRITAEEHPEAIKRYRHLRPARGRRRRCSARGPGISRACTRERGHRGPHAAHGRFRRVVAVWDAEVGAGRKVVRRSGPPPPAARRPEGKRPVGLPQAAPVGIVRTAVEIVKRGLSSWDQVAFVVLFIVFVKFAIDVLMTLY